MPIVGSSPPPKPWERAGSSSGGAPFKPPSPGSTSDVVEASGTARPGEIVSTNDATTAVNRNSLGRPVPARPWEQQTYGTNTYGGIYSYICVIISVTIYFLQVHVVIVSPFFYFRDNCEIWYIDYRLTVNWDVSIWKV